MSDATSVLFGLEDEFSVLEVQRVDITTVKVIIEQTAREGPCPACGVVSGTVKDRPLMRLKDLPISGQTVELWWRKRRLICARGAVSAQDVHSGLGGGAAAGAGDRAAAAAGGDGDRVGQPGRLGGRRRVRGVLADRAQGAGRGGGEVAAGAGADEQAGDR